MGTSRRSRSSQNGKSNTQSGNLVSIRFTGAAGGTLYSVGDKVVLTRGDEINVPYEGHWINLVLSGNAEIVEQ